MVEAVVGKMEEADHLLHFVKARSRGHCLKLSLQVQRLHRLAGMLLEGDGRPNVEPLPRSKRLVHQTDNRT